MLLVLNLPLVGLFARLLLVPSWFLFPMILGLSFAGVYAATNSSFELVVTVLLGILAYVMRKIGFPLIPLLIAFVLARLFEDNLRRAMSLSDGDPIVLLSSPVALIFWLLALLALLAPIVAPRIRHRVSEMADTET
jgi:putative tricarboxylic transport membrane protein